MGKKKKQRLRERREQSIPPFTPFFDPSLKNAPLSPDQTEAHNAFVEEVIASRPSFKIKIDQKIDQALQLLQKEDPIELLSAVSWDHIFSKSVDGKTWENEGMDAVAEYAVSLATSHDSPTQLPHASKEAIEELNKVLYDILLHTSFYYGAEDLGKKISC